MRKDVEIAIQDIVANTPQPRHYCRFACIDCPASFYDDCRLRPEFERLDYKIEHTEGEEQTENEDILNRISKTRCNLEQAIGLRF